MPNTKIDPKNLEKKVSTIKKINSEAPNSAEKRKEVSQIKSAKVAAVEIHNESSDFFAHANTNRGK